MTVPARSNEGIYRRVTVRMYGDERFMKLSPLQPSGQALWMYLLTGPHTTPIPGVFVIGRAAMAEALGWEPAAFDQCLEELLALEVVEFDPARRLWFIPNAIRHNMPPNPNVVRSWRSHWALLPECEMRDRIGAHLCSALYSLAQSFGEAFEETCGKSSPKPSGNPSTKCLGDGYHHGSAKQEAGSRKQDKRHSSPAGSDGVVPAGFRDFWNAWPKSKRKEARSKCLSVWVRNRLEQDSAEIVRHVLSKASSDDWLKAGGEYVPAPLTYLNQRRWDGAEQPDVDDHHPVWATEAGFRNRFEAENEGCYSHNAGMYRQGRRITEAA